MLAYVNLEGDWLCWVVESEYWLAGDDVLCLLQGFLLLLVPNKLILFLPGDPSWVWLCPRVGAQIWQGT